jgi:hypothetical protein
MKLSIRGLAIAGGLLWGGAIFCAGLAHLAAPGYGGTLLAVAASMYPGFHGGRDFGDVVVGTLYALVDGGVGGLLLVWLYNAFAGSASRAAAAAK